MKKVRARPVIDKTKLMFYFASGLLALSIIILAIAIRIEHRNKISSITSPSSSPYGINRNITSGDVTVKVNEVSFSGGRGSFSTPSGKHYLVILFSVKNNSAHDINILPANDTYVKDSAGNVIYLTPFNLDRPFRAGALPPSEQILGQLSFLVPEKGKLKFYVDGIWSGGVLSFAIN